MPRSLAGGDYRLLMAVESSTRPDSYYRICLDLRDGALCCDCHAWTFAGGSAAQRRCKHTDIAQRLRAGTAAGTTRAAHDPAIDEIHPLIQATREQWQGLTGHWSLEERDAAIGGERYRFVLLNLVTMNGVAAHGVVAFASRHQPAHDRRIRGVAGWAGYMIAGGIAQVAGYRLVGQPPNHFRVSRRTSSPADATGRGRGGRVGLSDILHVGETRDLGDGLTPRQRAEDTLRLFLGPMFDTLQQQGFLDVSSQRYPGRVYRLRRDLQRLRDRRVRVFEAGHYMRDLCIIRAQDCPADDGWLSTFLRLLSDEDGLLGIVKAHNVFAPFSDGRERETVPAVWQLRAA